MNLRQLANKALNELDIRRGARKLASSPMVVDLILTKACNLACTFCKDYELDGSKNVSRENLQKVAEQLFPNANRLSICSGGEPYLHRELEFILRLAARYDLYTWVLSNGMLLKEDRMSAIIDEGLITEHGFSCDGIEPATVEAIRVFAKLPVILENVKMVMRLRDSMRKKNPSITIRYALMRSNIEELPRAIDYWGSQGANRLNCGYLSLANGIPHEQSLFYHQDLMLRVFDEARKVAARYPELTVTLPASIEDERRRTKPEPCLAPWRFVMIDASGGILPCYRAFEGMVMGNIYETPTPDFQAIWNSEPYQQLRGTVNDDGAAKFFQYCSRCEMRHGWGEEAVHLGDETWLTSVAEQAGEEALVQIDHRRLKKTRP